MSFARKKWILNGKKWILNRRNAKESGSDVKEISKKISDYEYILECVISRSLYLYAAINIEWLFFQRPDGTDVIIDVIFGNRVRQRKGEDYCNSCRYVV